MRVKAHHPVLLCFPVMQLRLGLTSGGATSTAIATVDLLIKPYQNMLLYSYDEGVILFASTSCRSASA